jgi:hypothetical protein
VVVDRRPVWQVNADAVVGVGQAVSAQLLCLLGEKAYCPAAPVAASGGGAAAAGGAPESGGVVGVSLSDFMVLPIAASGVESDLGGFGLRNAVTNVWATSEVQDLSAEVLGQGVQVRAKPVEWEFDYGDGTPVRVSRDPGGPLPEAVLTDAEVAFETETATSHRYTETGTYQVRVSTRFTGEYRLAGGGWVPIPGSTQVASEPFTVDIWRTKHLHVSGPCRPGQTTAGCPG